MLTYSSRLQSLSRKSCRRSDLTLCCLTLMCDRVKRSSRTAARSNDIERLSQPGGGRERGETPRPFSDGALDLWRSPGSPCSQPHALLPTWEVFNLSSSGSISLSLCRTERRHSLPGMTHLKDDALGFICIKGKVPRKQEICGSILEAFQIQEINRIPAGFYQWTPVIWIFTG